MSDATKTPRLDGTFNVSYSNQRGREAVKAAVLLDIAALETRYQENWNKNERTLLEKHKAEIKQARIDAFNEAITIIKNIRLGCMGETVDRLNDAIELINQKILKKG